ncbi:MAG: hypothetical protein B7Y61_24490, partial [Rhizobiales bacterium 35-66-30]
MVGPLAGRARGGAHRLRLRVQLGFRQISGRARQKLGEPAFAGRVLVLALLRRAGGGAGVLRPLGCGFRPAGCRAAVRLERTDRDTWRLGARAGRRHGLGACLARGLADRLAARFAHGGVAHGGVAADGIARGANGCILPGDDATGGRGHIGGLALPRHDFVQLRQRLDLLGHGAPHGGGAGLGLGRQFENAALHFLAR